MKAYTLARVSRLLTGAAAESRTPDVARRNKTYVGKAQSCGFITRMLHQTLDQTQSVSLFHDTDVSDFVNCTK